MTCTVEPWASKPERDSCRKLKAQRFATRRAVLVLLYFGAAGCGFGRLARHASVERAGEEEFAQIMSRNGFHYATDPALTAPVTRVATRILAAARTSEYAARAGQVRWDVAVVDAPDIANAFATPGGRIIVFTGLFPAACTEAGLAAVLGHEVAHVLKEHARNEHDLRQNTASLAAISGLLAGAALGVATSNADVGSKVAKATQSNLARHALTDIVLPYSREQEMEADRIGVALAARAGYDPRAALAVFERTTAHTTSQGTARSTHPSATERRAALQIWASDALILYRGNAPGAEHRLPLADTCDQP